MKFFRFPVAALFGVAIVLGAFVAPPARAATAVDSTAVLPFALSIAPAHPTVCDSVWLVIDVPCSECAAVDAPSVLDSSTAITWRSLPCTGAICTPRSLRVLLGRFAAGSFHLNVVTLRVADTANYPPVIVPLAFAVDNACGTVPQLPTLTTLHIGLGAPCDTCVNSACPGAPIPVTLSGLVPSRCWALREAHVIPEVGPFDDVTIIAEFVHDCGFRTNGIIDPCKDGPASWFTSLSVPSGAPGAHRMHVVMMANLCPDTLQVVTGTVDAAYRVLETCPGSDSLPFATFAVVGTPGPCLACPPAACPGVPVPVAVSGYLPVGCWVLDGIGLVTPLGGVASDPEIDVLVHAAGPACGVPAPFGRLVYLPATQPGPHALTLRVIETLTGDSVATFSKRYAFNTRESCDSVITRPSLTAIRVGDPVGCDSCPTRICPGVPVPVRLTGRLPDACWTVRNTTLFTPDPIGGDPIVAVEFARVCGAPCAIGPFDWSTTVTLPPQPRGAHGVNVRLLANVCPDTVRGSYLAESAQYVVSDSCAPIACVFPMLLTANQFGDSANHCAVTVPPGHDGAMTFFTRSTGVALAGLQGHFDLDPALHLTHLDAIGAASGMHLVWNARPAEHAVDFVLYADHGAPIPADVWAPVLVATLRPDSSLRSGSFPIGTQVSAASDSNAVSVPACVLPDRMAIASLLCIEAADTLACDVNHDGVVNVVDLVRMVRCWFHPERCGGIAAGPDCTGDGAFHLDDVMCCARRALGVRDSIRHDASRLALSMDTPVDRGDGTLDATLVLRGASEMNGALLQLRYPADRYDLVADAGAGEAQAGWVPLYEPGAGDVVVGLLRVDDACADEVRVPLHLKLKAGRTHGGTLDVGSSAITGADGAALTVDVSHATTSLVPGETALPARVELSAPRPNPTGGLTQFDVALPVAGDVDLALYDLAGRRVATLWRGVMPAGRHSLSWDASGTPRGMYFARLRVGGEVRASRVTLQSTR